MASDPKVYPQTAEFEKFLNKEMDFVDSEKALQETEPDSDLKGGFSHLLAKILLENLGEVEHGGACNASDYMPEEMKDWLRQDADPGEDRDHMEDLMDKWALQFIRTVYEDLFLIQKHQDE